MGMWQATHSLPVLPALWWPCAARRRRRSCAWQGRHDWFACSPSKRGRPLGVWQWLQSSLPDLRQGLIEPGSEGVVLAQVAAVGIVVGMLQRDQVEVVEELVAGGEVGRQRH